MSSLRAGMSSLLLWKCWGLHGPTIPDALQLTLPRHFRLAQNRWVQKDGNSARLPWALEASKEAVPSRPPESC
jgi:hypothetical protein